MRYRLPIAMLTLSLCACAGLPPSANDLSHAPQIEFGQALPAGNHYILHYPAGTPLPVSASVDGSLFSLADQTDLHVTLKRDLYVFGQFVSFDGKDWRPSRDVIETKLELRIPQEDGKKAGRLHIQLDLK
ncbi:MAG: hypothetical protein HY849_04585 [Nitrosomonadales bacterium]|nr:hypothetical protein [Nitrosomonadales bacterium]